MAKIQQLSPHVADLIAAGEVVERPASAAKELVENAIDAGAKNITVEIQNGGMTFLRVTDDGCGIPAQEAETAFLRHATSKLRTASDLEAIHTLGFRGEALAAISAVSRIDLMTKTEDEPFGTGLHLEAGVVKEREEAGCPQGTTIIVRDLFYNTPARMKFMKKDSVEASALLSTVQRLALAHPEVSIRVIRDGQEQLHTPGDGELLSAVYAVMGKQTAKNMTPVKSTWEKYSLSGYVSLPTATHGTRGNQIFFVNGRHVRSKTMTAALEEAYRNQLMVGRFPLCVLHLRLPEHLVDVNVHPAKTEVKFVNERDIFDSIHYGVRGALDNTSGRTPMQFSKNGKPEIPSAVGSEGSASMQLPGSEKTSDATLKDSGFFRTMDAKDYRAFVGAMDQRPTARPSEAVMRQVNDAIARQSGVASHALGGARLAASGQKQYTAPSPSVQSVSLGKKSENATAVEQDTRSAILPSFSQEDRLMAAQQSTAEAVKRSDAAEGELAQRDDADIFTQSETRQSAAEDAAKAETAEQQDLPEKPMKSEETTREKDGGQTSSQMTIPTEGEQLPMEDAPELPVYRVVGEVLDTYIIVEQEKEILLIDKHAAHERILFERFRENREPIMPQLLLTPILCQPEREEAAVLLENETLLEQLGFSVSDFGDGVLAIRQIPAELDGEQATATLTALAVQLMSGKRPEPEALREQLLHTIACKAAIKGGRYTDPVEREALVREVLHRPELKYCPHGRPICIVMTASQIERQFKRA